MTVLPTGERRQRALLVGLLLAAAALWLGPLARHAALHCDETNALRHIGLFAEGHFGQPGRPGLLWLVLTPLMWLSNPRAIALAGRCVGWVAAAGGLCATGLWAAAGAQPEEQDGRERGFSLGAGLSGGLLLLLAATWFTHSFELRTDNLVAPLGLACAWLLYRARPDARSGAAAGALLATMALFSQKSLYNGVALALGSLVILALRPRERVARLRQGLVLVAVTAGLIVLWYAVMGRVSGSTTDFVGAQVVTVSRTAAPDAGRWRQNLKRLGEVAWACVPLSVSALLGLGWQLVGRRPWRGRRLRADLLALAVYAVAMLGTLVFHRGYWLYFIGPLLMPLAVLAGRGCSELARALGDRLGRRRLDALLMAALLLWGLRVGWSRRRRALQVDNGPQLELMEEAHALFPDPVPYLDRVGLMPGYREVTHFGTGSTLAWFRARYGEEGFIERVREQRPEFMVRNYFSRMRYFTPSERRWLWRHFLPLRANLYVAGGRLAVSEAEPTSAALELLHEGTWSVVFWDGFRGRVELEGVGPLVDGQQLELPAGIAQLRAEAEPGGAGQVWLVHGAERRPEARGPSEVVDWSLFPLMKRTRYQRYDRSSQPGDLLTPPQDPSSAPRDVMEARHAAWQEAWERAQGDLPTELLE